MQQKYLAEAHELYDEFFHIIQLPLLTEEVRGPEKLKEFSKMLVEPYQPDLDWPINLYVDITDMIAGLKQV